MKKQFTIILLAFNLLSQAQNNDFERVYVEVGISQPIGKLADKFQTAPSFGFWFRNRFVKRDFIDLGFNFFVPSHPKTVNFKYRDSVLEYKSKHFALNIGARFVKIAPLTFTKNDINFEWNTGFGLALHFYQAPKEIVFGEGEYSREILTTFFLSQGLKVNYKNLGLQCHYQWLPYSLFNEKVPKDYGSQLIMFGILYKQ